MISDWISSLVVVTRTIYSCFSDMVMELLSPDVIIRLGAIPVHYRVVLVISTKTDYSISAYRMRARILVRDDDWVRYDMVLELLQDLEKKP